MEEGLAFLFSELFYCHFKYGSSEFQTDFIEGPEKLGYYFIIYVLSVKSLKMTSLNSINNEQMCFSMVCISSYGGDRGIN